MKRLTRIFITVVLMLCLSITANAQIDINTEVENNNTVTVTGESDYIKIPVSVKIYNSLKKVYIDQTVTDDDGSFEFSFSLDKDETYDGKVNIKGETEKFSVTAEGINDNPAQSDSVKISIKGYKNSSILSSTSIDIAEGDTVLDVLKAVCSEKDIDLVVKSGYVASIDGLSEFDHGTKSGWMVKINGTFIDVGANDAEISDGDVIVWVYTTDLGDDVGNSYSSSEQNNTIENAKKIVENFEEYSEAEIDSIFDELLELEYEEEKIDTVIELAFKIIEKTGKYSINSKTNNNKATADLNLKKLKEIIKDTVNKAKELNKKINDEKINLNKQISKKITIEVSSNNEEEINTVISKEAIGEVIDSGIDKLEIKTENAYIAINPEEFDGDLSLTAKKVNIDELSEDMRKQIPPNAAVIDLDLLLDNEKKSNFLKPVKVSIPYNQEVAKDEYVSAFYLNDSGELEIIGGKYSSESKTVTFLTNHFSMFFGGENEINFSDIRNIEWASENIKIMASKGFISGQGENKFKPSDNITRAEFSALICRMLKFSEQAGKDSPFEDIKEESWYFDYVNTVYQNKLVSGKSSTTFDPEKEITRQEIAKIIALVLKDEGYNKASMDELNTFIDEDSIADWAKEYVALVVREGIINGMANGYFKPENKATRAETVVMLYRLFNIIY